MPELYPGFDYCFIGEEEEADFELDFDNPQDSKPLRTSTRDRQVSHVVICMRSDLAAMSDADEKKLNNPTSIDQGDSLHLSDETVYDEPYDEPDDELSIFL